MNVLLFDGPLACHAYQHCSHTYTKVFAYTDENQGSSVTFKKIRTHHSLLPSRQNLGQFLGRIVLFSYVQDSDKGHRHTSKTKLPLLRPPFRGHCIRHGETRIVSRLSAPHTQQQAATFNHRYTNGQQWIGIRIREVHGNTTIYKYILIVKLILL